MSPPRTTGGYGLAPGEGEALWFNGGLGVLRATGDQTEGRFAVMELLAPKGFASPLHIHRKEDELFVVLSGSDLWAAGSACRGPSLDDPYTIYGLSAVAPGLAGAASCRRGEPRLPRRV